MRKQILLLVLGLISGCTQPSVTVVAPQSTAPIVKQSDVMTSTQPQTQASTVVTPNTQVVVMPDGTLMPKSDGKPENIVNPTPTPSSYTNSQPYVPVASPTPTYNPETDGPIRPEDRGKGQPATPCDAYGNTSVQCNTYLESQKPPKPPYAVNHPVAENIRTGDVSITFKDEFKVRFSKDPNATGFKLTSISNQDKLKEVENIFNQYNIKNLRDLGYSEDRANEIEITNEKECQCDDSNFLSSYFFTIENQNMKEMIEKLRSISIVREVNYAAPTTTGFN